MRFAKNRLRRQESFWPTIVFAIMALGFLCVMAVVTIGMIYLEQLIRKEFQDQDQKHEENTNCQRRYGGNSVYIVDPTTKQVVCADKHGRALP